MLTFTFVLFAFIMIGLAIGGKVVQNRQLRLAGTNRVATLNQITRQTNEQIRKLEKTYTQSIIDSSLSRSKQKELKSMIDYQYKWLVGQHKERTAQAKATLPPPPKNKMKRFWSLLLAAGFCLSLVGCFGSIMMMPDSEQAAAPRVSTEADGTAIWNADNLPMPHFEDKNQYVANPENILTDNATAIINQTLRRLDDSLGVESAVAIVYHIENDDPFRVAQDLGNKYGVGRDDKGLVIIIGYGDHNINISTGKSLEADLTDIECRRMEEEYVIPFMREEQPDSALIYLTQAIYDKLQNKELKAIYEPELTDEELDGLLAVFGYFCFFCLWFLVLLYVQYKGLMSKEQGRLIKLLGNPTAAAAAAAASGFSGGSGFGGFGGSSHSGGGFSGGSYGGGSFGGGGASARW